MGTIVQRRTYVQVCAGVSKRVGYVVGPVGDLRRQWYCHRRTRVFTDLAIGKVHVEGGQVSVASPEGRNEKDESARRLRKRMHVDYGAGVGDPTQSWRQASVEMKHT